MTQAIIDLVYESKVKIEIKNGNGIIDGQDVGLIIVLYALEELLNNVELNKSKPTTLEFKTENYKLFTNVSGDKKILNHIIDNMIIQVKDNLDEKFNNEIYNKAFKALGHILYQIIKKNRTGGFKR